MIHSQQHNIKTLCLSTSLLNEYLVFIHFNHFRHFIISSIFKVCFILLLEINSVHLLVIILVNYINLHYINILLNFNLAKYHR